MVTPLVALIVYWQSFCSNRCQFFDFYKKFWRIIELGEEFVELHEKLLLITFWKKRVKICMIAHLADLKKYI